MRTPPWLITKGVMNEADPLRNPRWWSRCDDLTGTSWEHAICSQHPNSYVCNENFEQYALKHLLPSVQEVTNAGEQV